MQQEQARKVGAIAALIALVIVVAGLAFVGWLLTDDRRLPSSAETIEIAPGETLSEIATRLADERVVSSGKLLEFYLRSQHLATSIQAAEYEFPAHLTIPDVATILKKGGRPSEVWITVPEGFTASQIAERLMQRGIESAPSFLLAAKDTALNVDGWTTRSLEGYLYPNTYLVPRHASGQAIAGLMTSQFMHNLPVNAKTLARKLGFGIPSIVTIASMVEREAKVDAERPVIAGVIYNRLRLRMPLEIDATIEYALPRHKQALSLADLVVDSPYNTYTHTGLPPTPIANPGEKSLLAAFHPARVDYLYYVYRGHGRHQFSRTLQEQQAAEQKYLH